MKRVVGAMDDSEVLLSNGLRDSNGAGAHDRGKGIPQVEPRRDHFPLCIVWTPLPLLTWIIPFIGHLGIVKSDGEIHDFAGPYFVNRHPTEMGFGKATKYWRVDASSFPRLDSQSQADGGWISKWDAAVEHASQRYDHEMHNLLCNNCHSHVAMALNSLQFRGITYWNTALLIIYLMWFGKFASTGRFIQTYLGFFVILLIVVGVALAVHFGAVGSG